MASPELEEDALERVNADSKSFTFELRPARATEGRQGTFGTDVLRVKQRSPKSAPGSTAAAARTVGVAGSTSGPGQDGALTPHPRETQATQGHDVLSHLSLRPGRGGCSASS